MPSKNDPDRIGEDHGHRGEERSVQVDEVIAGEDQRRPDREGGVVVGDAVRREVVGDLRPVRDVGVGAGVDVLGQRESGPVGQHADVDVAARRVTVVVVDRGGVLAVGVGGHRGDQHVGGALLVPDLHGRPVDGVGRARGVGPPHGAVDADHATGPGRDRLRGPGAAPADLGLERVGFGGADGAVPLERRHPLETEVLLAALAHQDLVAGVVDPDGVGGRAPGAIRIVGGQRGRDRRTGRVRQGGLGGVRRLVGGGQFDGDFGRRGLAGQFGSGVGGVGLAGPGHLESGVGVARQQVDGDRHRIVPLRQVRGIDLHRAGGQGLRRHCCTRRGGARR